MVGKWVVGGLVAILGLVGLFVASKAGDDNMYFVGLVFFIGALVFVFSLIGSKGSTA